jgi:hypothetical protein
MLLAASTWRSASGYPVGSSRQLLARYPAPNRPLPLPRPTPCLPSPAPHLFCPPLPPRLHCRLQYLEEWDASAAGGGTGAAIGLLGEVKGNTVHYLRLFAEAADEELATLHSSRAFEPDVWDQLQDVVGGGGGWGGGGRAEVGGCWQLRAWRGLGCAAGRGGWEVSWWCRGKEGCLGHVGARGRGGGGGRGGRTSNVLVGREERTLCNNYLSCIA